MKKELQLNIRRYGVIVPELARIVGKHNEESNIVSLAEVDMLLYAMQKNTLPDYTLTTQYGDEIEGQPFELSVFENGELVCVVIEKEIYSLGQKENPVLNAYLNNPEIIN